jgi:hypothetical protein
MPNGFDLIKANFVFWDPDVPDLELPIESSGLSSRPFLPYDSLVALLDHVAKTGHQDWWYAFDGRNLVLIDDDDPESAVVKVFNATEFPDDVQEHGKPTKRHDVWDTGVDGEKPRRFQVAMGISSINITEVVRTPKAPE